MTTFDVPLAGCRPEPLAAYLKALGVLRLVAEQADPAARGWWDGDRFVLRSRLDEAALIGFFVAEYRPTPIIAPWNGGSGFYAKDNQSGIAAIEGTSGPRFASYRQAIATGRTALRERGLTERPADEAKRELLEMLRGALEEDALAWLDAALVLTDTGPRFPPLLGTGGNDGRLDFTNNQMQRLAELLLQGKASQAERLLEATLLDTTVAGLTRGAAIGQFDPAAAGGTNSSAGFSRESVTSPWSYVLMIEGSLLFAAAATRRLEDAGAGSMVYPFMVRSSGAGYASATLADERSSRDELWLPLWRRPLGLPELRALLAEGRAQVGPRPVRSGVDFARAIAALGVDRGIDAFVRFAFLQRNGLSIFAVPLGQWQVRRNQRVDLLAPLDHWLDRFRRVASDAYASAALRQALRSLEEAIFDLCRDLDRTAASRELLEALGEAERVVASSSSARDLWPIPPLDPAWLDACDDGSIEFRLAASLASTGAREYLEPFRWASPTAWVANDDRRTVWGPSDLTRNLLAMLARRELDHERDVPPPWATPRRPASLGDVAAFIDGQTDDRRLESLLRGLALIDWREVTPSRAATGASHPLPCALHTLLRLVHERNPAPGVDLPRTPALLRRATSGDGYEAARLAIRRLTGAGLIPVMTSLTEPRERTRRSAAALAFPLSRRDQHTLFTACITPLRTEEPDDDRDHAE